jgi:hypothetical protein
MTSEWGALTLFIALQGLTLAGLPRSRFGKIVKIVMSDPAGGSPASKKLWS